MAEKEKKSKHPASRDGSPRGGGNADLVVPEGMILAVRDRDAVGMGGIFRWDRTVADLTAALKWLDHELEQKCLTLGDATNTPYGQGFHDGLVHVRRMFVKGTKPSKSDPFFGGSVPDYESHLVRDGMTLCGLTEWTAGNVDIEFGVKNTTTCVPCLRKIAQELWPAEDLTGDDLRKAPGFEYTRVMTSEEAQNYKEWIDKSVVAAPAAVEPITLEEAETIRYRWITAVRDGSSSNDSVQSAVNSVLEDRKKAPGMSGNPINTEPYKPSKATAWQPSSNYAGYEQRRNDEGYLETRPMANDKKDPLDQLGRDDLIKLIKNLQANALHQSNHPPLAICPFCLGERYVPSIKRIVREHLISQWSTDVTQEENEAWSKKHQ